MKQDPFKPASSAIKADPYSKGIHFLLSTFQRHAVALCVGGAFLIFAASAASVSAQSTIYAPSGIPGKPKPRPSPTPIVDPTYYWNGTGAINNVTSWGQNPDGSG